MGNKMDVSYTAKSRSRKCTQVLLPLVSTTKPLRMSLLPEKAPPRVWVAQSDIDSLGDDCYCTDVLRKGKQLCLVLEPGAKAQFGNSKRYLFLHMVRHRFGRRVL